MPHRLNVSAATLAFLLGLATIAGAWAFQLIGGFLPCKLCLQERIPYYAGLPLLLVALVLSARAGNLARWLALLAGVVFLAGAGLGVYHAGAELSYWPGPSDCGGASAVPLTVEALGQAMKDVKLVSCTDPTYPVPGVPVSFAGFNAIIAAVIALLSFVAARGRPAA